jgi:hypothetical protein
VAYLPSPLDVPDVKGSDVDDATKALTRKAADEESFSALAFKIMADQFVGSLTFLRIYRCLFWLRLSVPVKLELRAKMRSRSVGCLSSTCPADEPKVAHRVLPRFSRLAPARCA